MDRIADLEILVGEDVRASNATQYSNMDHGKRHMTQPMNQYLKKCYLEHDWEQYSVTFSVSYPIDFPLSTVFFHDCEDNKKMMMTKQKSSKWIISKYGDYSTPYEISLKLPNLEGGVNGQWAADADQNFYAYTYSRQAP